MPGRLKHIWPVTQRLMLRGVRPHGAEDERQARAIIVSVAMGLMLEAHREGAPGAYTISPEGELFFWGGEAPWWGTAGWLPKEVDEPDPYQPVPAGPATNLLSFPEFKRFVRVEWEVIRGSKQ